MNVQEFKRRLVELETQLSARTARGHEAARAQIMDSPGDIGDASTAGRGEGASSMGGTLPATVLQQVRDALRRIEDGTFGHCVVDGGPIEQKRLEAVPWTPHCLKHQRLLEASSRSRTPSL
jgi:DnaK suppressor protein